METRLGAGEVLHMAKVPTTINLLRQGCARLDRSALFSAFSGRRVLIVSANAAVPLSRVAEQLHIPSHLVEQNRCFPAE